MSAYVSPWLYTDLPHSMIELYLILGIHCSLRSWVYFFPSFLKSLGHLVQRTQITEVLTRRARGLIRRTHICGDLEELSRQPSARPAIIMRLFSHALSFTQPAAHSAILTGRAVCHLRALGDSTLYYSASSQYLFCKIRACHNSLELE